MASTATFNSATFPVQGMSCGSCIRHIKAALALDAGIKAVEVDLAAKAVTVSYDPRITRVDAIGDAIRQSGYTPGPPKTE